MIDPIPSFLARKKQEIKRTVLWITVFIAFWAVLAGLILPPIIRHVAVGQLSEKLGSACTLETVRFNPFTLRLTAANLRIPLPDGEECFSLERFEVRLSPAGIYRLAPVLSDLKLTRPHLEISLRKDGGISLTELGRAPKDTSPEESKIQQIQAADTAEKEWNLFGIMLTDLEITGGSVHFRDAIRETEHTVAKLGFYVPFTSTLKRHRERSITPYLEAVINGRPLRVEGRLAPFAEQLHTEFDIRLDNLDLARFQPYVRPFTSATLDGGQLSTNLVFSMRQEPDAGIRLGLAGQTTLSDLAVLSPDGEEVLRLPQLATELTGALNRPEGLTLNLVSLRGLEVHLALLENGRLDWQTWLKKPIIDEKMTEKREKQTSWLPLHLKYFELREARLLWRDQKVKGGFEATAEQIDLTLSDLSLPGSEPAEVSASLTLNSTAPFSLQGKLLANPLQADALLRLDGLSTSDFQPYVAASGIPVTLQKGIFSGTGRLKIGDQEGLTILFTEGEANLRELSLLRNDTGKAFLRMQTLALTGVTADILKHRLEAEQLLLDRPELTLLRDREGIIDLSQLRPPSAARSAKKAAQESVSPWQARLAELKLEGGQIAVHLEGPRETSTAIFQKLTGSVTGLDTTANPPLNFELRGRQRQGGSLNIRGKTALKPLDGNLNIRTDRLNLEPFSPLLGQINPALRFGAGTLTLNLGTELKKAPSQTSLRIRGQAEVHSLSLLDGKQEFAALGTLRLRDLDIQPARQRYTTGPILLTRPHINLITGDDGVNNLARLIGQPSDRADEAHASSPASKNGKNAKTPPYLGIGGLKISEASLSMRDERYQPVVSNHLDKLSVTVGPLENTPDSLARFSFSAELNGAPIRGEGAMNPLRTDAFAELQAQLKTLNLTPLSPLSERYIAYPLQRGVFSLDSEISIDEGQLDSTHRIRLDGLELGDKVKSSDAPNLPVKLGVSLLQNPAGNINLTLPVRGNLRDPSFSVGGLVFKVIANLLVKAVASPFVFLGNLMGAGEESLEYIAFDPGDSRLPVKAAKPLSTIAEMLVARPKIDLVLIPHADEKDREELADAYVRRRMQELKHAELPEQERSLIEPQELPVGPKIDADEYAKLLFEVYAEQPFDKPKNLLGMVRKLPPQKMMERIREQYPRDDKTLEQLALERARHLREAFIALRPELEGRISVNSPKAPGEGHRVTFGIK
jgi:uncharacterized protein involved in outer membrane biogenesis